MFYLLSIPWSCNDTEKLDVSSDDFRLSDNNKIYLAGNVIIDFPEGMIYSNLANLDQIIKYFI